MNLLSEFINKFKDRSVKVHIYHQIYGDQKATIQKFHPFYTKDRIGFLVNEYEIFVHFDEIENVESNGNEFIISGALQKIDVKLI